MKKTNSVIYLETYDYDETFMVDITLEKETFDNGTTEEVYNAYLYAKGYGIKEHLFGWIKGQSNTKTEEEFLDMVECNLDFEDYINEYKEKWFQAGGYSRQQKGGK